MVRYLPLFVACLFACRPLEVLAQETPYQPSAIDDDYITDHQHELLVRAYGSHKFTRLSYGEYGRKEHVLYKPNSNYNIGVGFNYQWLGVNIGFTTPFVNNDGDKFGHTDYLDLQAYVYLRKFVIDFYAQSYESYFLANNEVLQIAPTSTLIRSDLQTRNLGVSVEYLFNHRKFSYRAAYLQNEHQKKSAGSFLAGAGFLYLDVRADSAILPAGIRYADFLANQQFNYTSTGVFSVHGGYAHTFVINQHFFVMGSVVAGIGANSMTIKDDKARTSDSKFSLSLNGIFRTGIGYNSDDYYAGVYFVTNLRHDQMPVIDAWQRYETGMLRVALAKRFTLKPKVVRMLEKTGLF